MNSPHRQWIDRFLRHCWPAPLSPWGTVLDIGYGPRDTFRPPNPRGSGWVRMDLSMKPGLSYVGDCTQLPHKSDHFDVVKATEMLYMVRPVDEAIWEFHRVLRPDGYLIATAPFLHPEMEQNDWVRMTAPAWSGMLICAGFSILKLTPLGGPYSGLCQLLHRGWPRTLGRAGRLLTRPAMWMDTTRQHEWPLAWGIVAQKKDV